MPTVDEELSQLDRDIRQMKIEYEQYFGGGRPRPPTDTIWRIEQIIKKHGERGGQLNFSQRFRLSSLTQTYAKYQEMFRKRLKTKEEGTVQRHYGAAARAIEAERERTRPEPPPPPAQEEKRPARLPGYATTFADPNAEKEKVEELYNVLLNAKQRLGEKVDSLNFEGFQQFVKSKTAHNSKRKARVTWNIPSPSKKARSS